MCVAWNETFRIAMEDMEFEPVSEPTERQRRFFSDTAYADDEEQMRRTILARICTFDTSVQDPTDEQIEEAVEFLTSVMESGYPQNEWEQSAVMRIRDALAETRANGTAGTPEAAPEDEGTVQGDVGGGEAEDDDEDRGSDEAPSADTEADLRENAGMDAQAASQADDAAQPADAEANETGAPVDENGMPTVDLENRPEAQAAAANAADAAREATQAAPVEPAGSTASATATEGLTGHSNSALTGHSNSALTGGTPSGPRTGTTRAERDAARIARDIASGNFERAAEHQREADARQAKATGGPAKGPSYGAGPADANPAPAPAAPEEVVVGRDIRGNPIKKPRGARGRDIRGSWVF